MVCLPFDEAGDEAGGGLAYSTREGIDKQNFEFQGVGGFVSMGGYERDYGISGPYFIKD